VKRLLPNGQVAEFSATERWKENYAVKGGPEKSIAPNAMWQKRPYAQLAKCAEAQALRKAFPEFGSAATADEMEGKEIDMGAFDRDTGDTNKKTETKTLLPYPQDKLLSNLETWRKYVQAGKKTASEIMDTIKSGYTLTADQEATIAALEPRVPIDGDFVKSMEQTEGETA
jgi:hypothetical protein